MNEYKFYAQPKDDSNIIVTANGTIHSLKFILLNSGLYKYYNLVNEPLTEDCFVEEYNSYKILTLDWKDRCKEGWDNKDTIPFSIILSPNYLIKCLKEFYNKPFITQELVNKLNEDSDFKYIVEEILGRDIDYVDMYFNMNENWSLSSISVKEITTINYKYINTDKGLEIIDGLYDSRKEI